MEFYKSGEGLFVLPNDIRFIRTGEKRCPKKGEYYLSGAIPEGYKAHNDMKDVRYILKKVKVERVPETYRIID